MCYNTKTDNWIILKTTKTTNNHYVEFLVKITYLIVWSFFLFSNGYSGYWLKNKYAGRVNLRTCGVKDCILNPPILSRILLLLCRSLLQQFFLRSITDSVKPEHCWSGWNNFRVKKEKLSTLFYQILKDNSFFRFFEIPVKCFTKIFVWLGVSLGNTLSIFKPISWSISWIWYFAWITDQRRIGTHLDKVHDGWNVFFTKTVV